MSETIQSISAGNKKKFLKIEWTHFDRTEKFFWLKTAVIDQTRLQFTFDFLRSHIKPCFEILHGSTPLIENSRLCVCIRLKTESNVWASLPKGQKKISYYRQVRDLIDWEGEFDPVALIPTSKGNGKAAGEISHENRDRRTLVFLRDGCQCLKCGSTENLTLDHVVPKSKGGMDHIDNLQTLCDKCNGKKGAKTVDYRKFIGQNDPVYQLWKSLYNADNERVLSYQGLRNRLLSTKILNSSKVKDEENPILSKSLAYVFRKWLKIRL